MKRTLITLLALFLATSLVWAQNTNTNAKPAKAKPAAADCSSTTDAQITDNVKAKLAKPFVLPDGRTDAARADVLKGTI